MQQLDMRFVLIIPCYNEELSIPMFFAELKEFTNSFNSLFANQYLEVVIVNNGSTDNSLKLLLEESKSLSGIHIIECLRPGYGAALKQGFTFAHQQLHADFYGFCDLDNTYPLSALIPMYESILKDSKDIVFADRMSKSDGLTITRKFGNWMYVKLCQWFFDSKLKDVCTGQRIFTKNKINEVLNLDNNGLNFSIDFTCCVLKRKWNYHQISINYHNRTGESKLNALKDGVAFLITLLRWAYKNE